MSATAILNQYKKIGTLLTVCVLCLVAQAQTLFNGVPWYDQNGKPVNAHGSGIIRDAGKYWLFGEYKSDTTNAFHGFGCYSSEDLVNWHFERIVLPVQKDGILGPERLGERVKVMRCPKTGEYVMLMHTDNMGYKDPQIGIATCKTVNGNYQLRGTLKYKGETIKRWDMGVFQDEDGKGYLLVHHGPIYRLADDYLSVDTMVAHVEGMGESPAMFKKNGIYYLLTSNLTSWERNDNFYFTAPSISGPWKRQGLFCPEGSLTWNSQSTSVLMLPDGTPMYMGDRWSYPHQASSATYVWMPMKVEGERLDIPAYWQAWDVSKRQEAKVNACKCIPLEMNSNEVNKEAETVFEGCRVALVGETDSHGGYARITLYDEKGKEIHSALIDFYSKVHDKGIRYVSPLLPKARYRLKVKVTGERSNWADKRKNNYGAVDCYVQTSEILVLPEKDLQTFINPILGGDHPDPTIVRVGNDYYMTHSSFDYLPGLTIFHSTDLVHWTPLGSALHRNLGSVWSPDMCYYNGKYYIYFTVSKGNDDFYTYVVTAENPEGPWSEPIDLKVSKWIDPCHAYDEQTGRRWLFLSGGHRIQLAADGLSTVGELEKIYNGWKIPKNWIVEGTALEGPKVKKIGNYYYLLNAEGGTAGPATTHMTVVARTKSIDGPWENCPDNPLIHTYSSAEKWWSKGHASLIDTPDGKWWAVYHAYNKDRINQGRQTLMEPISLTEDGWILAESGANVDSPISVPSIYKTERENYTYSTALSRFRIGKEWRGLLDYDSSRWESDDKGSLTVNAKGTNPGESSPLLFVAPDCNYEMIARFEIKGEIEAGLLFYYNQQYYAGFGCSEEKMNCWRRGQRRGKGSNHLGKTFWVKLRFENNVVTGFVSKDGKAWRSMQWGMEVSGYNHNTLSGFLSLLPGIYCYGKGQAKISEFKYSVL